MPAFNQHWVDTFADVYEKNELSDISWFTGTVSPVLMELVIDGRIPRGSDVLDVGCGPGVHSCFLANHGMRVIGVDLSPGALATARSLAAGYGVDVDFRQGDIVDLPVDRESVDVVNDSFVFHNVQPSARSAYAAQIARVLKSGGLFVLVGFSDHMTPGTGPLRLTSDDVVNTFLPHFTIEELHRFRNLPTEKRPDQWHWAALFRRR